MCWQLSNLSGRPPKTIWSGHGNWSKLSPDVLASVAGQCFKWKQWRDGSWSWVSLVSCGPQNWSLQAIQFLCKGLQPGDSLSQMSNYQFRSLFKSLIDALGLSDLGYMPYSIRRGGVTSAYRQGVLLDTLVTEGRWHHLPTARL